MAPADGKGGSGSSGRSGSEAAPGSAEIGPLPAEKAAGPSEDASQEAEEAARRADGSPPAADGAPTPPGDAPHERSGRRRRRTLWILGLALAAGLALWFLAIPYPWGLRTRNPERTSLMEQRLEEARKAGDTLRIRQEWRSLDRISPNLARAVIVAEDHRFREHGGIDWKALAEEVEWTGDDDFSWWSASDLRALADAVGYVWAHRDEVRGRSTLTQQLAKNLWFGTDRSLLRKALEFVAARRLERRLDKDRILELYLNVVEWGPGIFGAEAAAQAYFGRPAASLTLDQAAALAATLPHPLTSNPAHDPGRMRWRKNLILERLRPGATPTPMPDVDIPDPEPRPGGVDRPGVDSITGPPPGLPSGTVDPVSDTLSPAPPDTASPPLPDTASPPPPDTTRVGRAPRST